MALTYSQAVAVVIADQRQSYSAEELPDSEVIDYVRSILSVEELDHNSTYDAYKLVLEPNGS